MTILPNGVAVCGTTHHVEWCAELGLVHDPWFAEQITRHLKPGDMVIEGGAHIGTLTRAMLDAGAAVHAFEPNMDAVECLSKNCGNGDLEIVMSGLGDGSDDFAMLHLNENAGASFVAKGGDGRHIRLECVDDYCRQEEVSPKLIKLDIEGYEAKALRGASETIARCKPVLFVEVNGPALERAGDSEDALLSLIEELGYSWEIIQPDCARGMPQYDLRCLPLQKHRLGE